MYNVPKLASHILKNHKSDLEMLDCKNMQELVKALQDNTVAETAIMCFGLVKSDFLEGDTKQQIVKVIPAQKDTSIPLPTIFSANHTKQKPEFLDVTTLAELLFQELQPINFPDGVLEDIKMEEGFLHNSHTGSSDLGVRYQNELISQFFVTQADQPKSNVSYLQKYDEKIAGKAWAKLVLIFDHLSALIALSEYTNQVINLLIDYCEHDLDSEKMSKFTNAIRDAVKKDVTGFEPEEEAWLVTNFLSQYVYKFALSKHRTAQNLNETYGKVPFVGGGDTNVPTIKPTEDFVKSLLEGNTPDKPASKPIPKPPVFELPEGTDKILTILADNEFEVKLPQSKNELTEFRSVCHECLKYYHTLRGKAKPVDEIKLLEDWLSK